MPIEELGETPIETAAPAPGFFGRLFGSPSASNALPDQDPVLEPDDGATALSLPIVPEMPEDQSGGFWSWFGGAGVVQPTSVAAVPAGTLVPYGELIPACGLSTRNRGREVEAASGYRVYDTDPTSIAPRTHYVTGFSDGCARQFTAALALFGDIGTHEIVRYGTADGGLEYTQTDNAYEEIKASFCGARAGQPCGTRIDRLARRTTFLTIYERFGTNPVWADVLLHDGEVVAVDFKGD
jgi:hypothetical protein